MDSADRSETHFVRCLKCYKILKCSRYDTSSLLEHIRSEHPEIEIVEGGPPKPTHGENGARQTVNSNQVPMPRPTQLSIQSEKLDDDEYGNENYNGNGNANNARGKRLPEIKICDEQAYAQNGQDIDVVDPEQPGEEDDDAKVIYTRRYSLNSPAPPYVSMAPSPRRRSLYRTSIEKWRPANGTIYCPKCGCNKRPLIKTSADRAASNSCGAACILGCWPFCFLPCMFPTDNKEYLHCANCRNFLGLYDRNANCVKPNREFVDQVDEEKANGVTFN